MKPVFSKQLRDLYRELVEAAKQWPWRTNNDPRIHHGASDRGNPDPDSDWFPHERETLRVEPVAGQIIHLQIQLEQRGVGQDQRVIIFGRRVKSYTHATPNTQRATFNSDHIDSSGYWLRPRLDPSRANTLSRWLAGPSNPLWKDDRIQLGMASPYVLLRRFIVALVALEDLKEGATGRYTPLLQDVDSDEEFELSDLTDLVFISEGRLTKVTAKKRARCTRLLGEAQEYFRKRSKDGRLHCHICDWAPPLPTRSEIIQLHHHGLQIHQYPKKGKRMTLKEAIQNLMPLCPNCHRLMESSPEGKQYSVDDVRNAQG